MLTRYYMVVICCLFSLASFAQGEPTAYTQYEDYNLWNLHKADTAYVFAEQAYIRSAPSLKGTILDTLSAGQQVLISSDGYNSNTIRGIAAPWHEVTYLKGAQRKKGFIWLGLLALNGSRNSEGLLFVTGFKKLVPETSLKSAYYETALKVFNAQQQLLTSELYQTDSGGQLGTESKLLGGMGLQNIKNIHRFGLLSGACGVPSLFYYFAWNGTTLIRFPDKMSVSDAGVFYHEETLLFPSEHRGDPNLVYKRTVTGENTDDSLDEPIYKETKSQRTYHWDGSTLLER